MMRRKGQAAMEFLMTYGWAILAAIIAIGVLATLGVFSPGSLAGTSATLSPPWNVDDFRIVDGTPDTITFIVSQNQGESLTLNSTGLIANADNDGFVVQMANGVPCNLTEGTGDPDVINAAQGSVVAWPAGQQITITASCGSAWSADDSVRGTFTVRYWKSGGLQQVSTGNFRGTAQ